MRRVQELLEVRHGPVGGMDTVEVGDVVAIVAERRGVHGQDPQAIDPQLLEVVEPFGQSDEVADTIPVGVLERLDVHLVEDRVLVPVVGHRFGPGPQWTGGTTPMPRHPISPPVGR
jgi:hypothetical protein